VSSASAVCLASSDVVRRKHESDMNSFPHFIGSITDDDSKKYDVHFVALFSENPSAVPLMLLHGWPGTLISLVACISYDFCWV